MKRKLFLSFAAGLVFLGCEASQPSVDWSATENFFLVEKADKNEDGSVRLEFHSLVDAPAEGVYVALSKPEDFVTFVEGVKDSGMVSSSGNSKVTHITQSVIGRQTKAEVRWMLHPDDRRIEFETTKSDMSYNDGSYRIIASPDGKRSYVISVFNVREKGGPKMPPGVMVSGTREAFAAAARSVKKRAVGG